MDFESEASSADIPCRCPSGEWISNYRASPTSTVPADILEFDYSFGYNAKKLFNLCLLDKNTLAFASGNLLHFFNLKSKELTFRRSALGGGIGFITKNPNPQYNYLTVAENGSKPPIIIYEYPSLKILHVLNDGAKRCFTHMSYSRDGELLASQAGNPDYMLTMWDWKKDQIILQVESFQNDVLNVIFSPYNPTHIITCGLGHIKFWKMNRTFTGLKLQGELGRFGKTEISDIYAVYPLPDEMVISGCDWGNMLLWDAGLIKFEVCRKNRKPCHTAPITQISMMEGEVMTVGMDGYVRIWFWETVDLADPPEDDRFVEIEPIYEFRIGLKTRLCELRHLIKKKPNSPEDYKYYAQDGNGGIWLCDLNPEKAPGSSERLYTCHEGAIVAIAPSPVSKHIATLGIGGRLHLYNYKTKSLMANKQYSAGGRDMIWLPPTIEPSGLVLVAGFEDGVIRIILVEIVETKSFQQRIFLVEAFKPHSRAITSMSINPKQTILASASEDNTIFIHELQPSSPFIKINPIGFITMLSIPTAIGWHPTRPTTIVVGCNQGHVAEIDVPDRPRSYTDVSYSLNHLLRKEFQFTSIKSEIRRQNQIDAINKRKQAKKERKLAEFKKIHPAFDWIEKDMEMYIVDSDPEEELEPLFYPKVPNRVLWLQYTPDDTIWLSLAGYDAGYIYECACDSNTINLTRSTPIADGGDIEITARCKIGNHLLFGMQDGAIRVVAEKENFRDLSDYWELTMHDNFNGRINAICSTLDYQYVFSIGNDGNLFCYKYNVHMPPCIIPQIGKHIPPKNVNDIEDINALSLEEEKQKFHSDNQKQQANERKKRTLDILSEYKLIYKDIMRRNRALPASQQLTHEELELDPRITAEIKAELNEQLELVRKKMAFEVEKATLAREKVMNHFISPLQNLQITVSPIRTGKTVSSFRIAKLDDAFQKAKIDVEAMIQERIDKKCEYFPEELEPEVQVPVQPNESFLLGFTNSTIDMKLNPKMKRLLEKYRHRKSQEQARDIERGVLEAEKPDPNQNHPDDERAIEEAKNSIGDYKLKTDPFYEPDESQNTLQKYKEIISTREELFNLQNNYNDKVFELRKTKGEIYQHIAKKMEELHALHERLPQENRKYVAPLPEIDMNKEYPEEALKPRTQTATGAKDKDTTSRRSEPSLESFLRAEKKKEDRYLRLENQILQLNPETPLVTFEEISEILDNQSHLTSQDQLSDFLDTSRIESWRKEIAFGRALTTLTEQDEIIEDIEYRINEFDQNLQKLYEDRLLVEYDAKFLELFLITLNQEFYILRDFERLEDDLVQEVETSVQKRNEIQANIIRAKNAMEDYRKSIETMVEQKKAIENQFMPSIQNNKFADFLRRIFKKKYKPRKEHAADESEESSDSFETSSSEEEEEDDAKSIDSLDVASVGLDENYCPPGCDQDLYDLTFALRAERHVLEQKVYEEHKSIDALKKQVEELNTNMRSIETQLPDTRAKLMEVRREKQQHLNKVETLVVLKMDQMQYFTEEDDFYDIDSTLLLSLPNVTKLYARVGQLNDETEEARQQHRFNIVHLSRMKEDCKYMEQRITSIKPEIDQAMIKKFGCVVNLDELEESVLRRFIYNLRANIEDEKKETDKKVAMQKEKLIKLQNELIKETQLGTEKINILTVLQEEKNYLRQVLQRQSQTQEKKMSKSEKRVDFEHDLNKLKDVEAQQREQIEYLEKEIRSLRLKAKTFLCPEDEKPDAPAYSEVLPPRDEFSYEDYVYLAVRESSQGKEGPSTNPKVEVFEKVNILVEKYLIKTLSNHVDEETIGKYTNKVAKHLAYVANNLNHKQSLYATECILKFIHKTIPKKLHPHIKDSELRHLFHEVISIVQDPNIVVNTTDIMTGIISSAQETIDPTQVSNFTQELVQEILKAMIEVLPISDICNISVIEQIANSLSQIEEVDARRVNFTQLAEHAIQHANDNMNDDITLNVVRRFTDLLAEALGPKVNSSKDLGQF